jgi:hypothetical protein
MTENLLVNDRLISIAEATQVFNIHRSTLYRRSGRELPEIRCVGGKRGMLLSEVRAVLGGLPTRATVSNDAAVERAASARAEKQKGRPRS